MKSKIRQVIIILTGFLFAAYSVYNVFVIVRDNKQMAKDEIIVSAIVAFVFAIFAVFAWTFKVKNIGFLLMRKTAFITSLLAVFALKLRLIGGFLGNLSLSNPSMALYFSSYILTLAASLALLVYYVFILRNLSIFPRASYVLPLIAMILFFVALVIDEILFLGFKMILEGNVIRTAVMHPVFYLGFIGLCAFFIFHPKKVVISKYNDPDDSELIKPNVEEYVAQLDPEYNKSGGTEFIVPENDEYVPDFDPEYIKQDGADFIAPEGDEYTADFDPAYIKQDGADYIAPENSEDIPDFDASFIKQDGSDFVAPNATDDLLPVDPALLGSEGKDFVKPADPNL